MIATLNPFHSAGQIRIKPGRDTPIRYGHPWVFSGAILEKSQNLTPGDVVEVTTSQGDFLGQGHYNDDSIAVKVFSFTPVKSIPDFLLDRVRAALSLRTALGLTGSSSTTAFRLINAEGDGLPGLIVDVYAETAVIQCQTPGMKRWSEEIAEALKLSCGKLLATLYLQHEGKYMFGTKPSRLFYENGLKFFADFESGQKTGFFLDQRENRALVSKLSSGRKVLDLFCYSGGFGVSALSGGAESVSFVDASEGALELARANVGQNCGADRSLFHLADCFDYVQEMPSEINLVVLDPPALAKHRRAHQAGIKGYEHLNYHVISRIAPGGLLFTFSCSQLISPSDFRSLIERAAARAHRQLKVLSQLGQAACHPVNLQHPEGAYLKGLLLAID